MKPGDWSMDELEKLVKEREKETEMVHKFLQHMAIKRKVQLDFFPYINFHLRVAMKDMAIVGETSEWLSKEELFPLGEFLNKHGFSFRIVARNPIAMPNRLVGMLEIWITEMEPIKKESE